MPITIHAKKQIKTTKQNIIALPIRQPKYAF